MDPTIPEFTKDHPLIITKGGMSTTQSNISPSEEMEEEGLFLDLLDNISYLGEAKVGCNLLVFEITSIFIVYQGETRGTRRILSSLASHACHQTSSGRTISSKAR